MNLLGVAPLFDKVTEYSLEWYKDAISQVREFCEVSSLVDDHATRYWVEGSLKMILPDIFIHYDHGSDYVMWGDDEKPAVDLDNLDLLKNVRVYTMNCSSGKGLGSHAVGRGVKEYLGYLDVVSFTTNQTDKFKTAFNYGLIKAIREGKMFYEVLESMRDYGYLLADEMRASGDFLGASCLARDMDILHCYYDGGADPPDPECIVSRIIKDIFGWRALFHLRRLRQRIVGESRIG